MNNFMNNFFRSALVVVLSMTSASVFAACAQSDMTGTWYFTGISGDSAAGELAETDSCKVKVGASGSVIASSSSCTLRNSAGKFDFPIVGGKLTVNEFCAIKGNLRYNIDGTLVRAIIDSARLDRQKTVITLVGRTDLNPDIIVSFSGVKK